MNSENLDNYVESLVLQFFYEEYESKNMVPKIISTNFPDLKNKLIFYNQIKTKVYRVESFSAYEIKVELDIGLSSSKNPTWFCQVSEKAIINNELNIIKHTIIKGLKSCFTPAPKTKASKTLYGYYGNFK